MIRIECFYYPGCASMEVVPWRINQALQAEGVEAKVSHHTISPEEGARRGLGGSPTILIDGRDMVASSGQGAT